MSGENQSILHWSPDTGFEIDIDFEAEDVSVRMVRVPVPADGTGALSRDAVRLHPLDVLFKSQVDVDGAPGQLDDVRVQLFGDAIRLRAVVEDAETGETRDLSVELPVDFDGKAPASGGPVPTPPDEDSLDWEDEETFERLFDGAPEATGRRRDPDTDEREITDDKDLPTDEKKSEKGLAALLKALMGPGKGAPAQEDLEDTDLDEDDDSEEAPPPPKAAPKTPPAKAAPAKATPAKAPAPKAAAKAPMTPAVPTGLLDEAGEARSFVEMMINEGHLELSEEGTPEELVPGVARRLASRGSAEDKAAQLSKWLLSQDAVDELYIDDDELAELIEKW